MYPSLFYERSYQVRSPLTVEAFTDFVGYPKSQRLPDVTTANVQNLFLLSHEFGVTDLLSECSRLVSDLRPVDFSPKSADPGQNSDILSSSTLFESFRRDFPSSFSDTIVSRLSVLEGEFAKLRSEMEDRMSKVESRLEEYLSLLDSKGDEFRRDIKELKQAPVFFGLNEEDPLDGMIDNLTWKQGGDLDKQGIISITSKPGCSTPGIFGATVNYVLSKTLTALLDLRSESSFVSPDEGGQWVCWDFGQKFIRLTHYTIRAADKEYPKSWVLEGSTDKENWTEIDRRKNDSHLNKPWAVQ
jgi:hypothetical protein